MRHSLHPDTPLTQPHAPTYAAHAHTHTHIHMLLTRTQGSLQTYTPQPLRKIQEIMGPDNHKLAGQKRRAIFGESPHSVTISSLR